jgi:Zn-dependent protease with chaperone function
VDFRHHQQTAARDSRRLWLLYGVAVVAVVAAFHLGCLFAWRVIAGDAPLPLGFFTVNLLATAGLIVGGSLLEYQRLDSHPSTVADRLGGRELEPGAVRLDPAERRLLNLVEEMALAAHQPVPRVHVLERDLSINALTTGMRREDATLLVTRGAIERLNRDELQGLVAHEIAHVSAGDVAIHTRTAALTTGLELVHDAGSRALALGYLYVLPGALLIACGWLGHLAGCLLGAAMSRQREWHADAEAVRLTRLPDGLAGALRKVQWLAIHSADRDGTTAERAAAAFRPAMFHVPSVGSRLLATHPPLATRVRRLIGRELPPLPCPLATRRLPAAFAITPPLDAGPLEIGPFGARPLEAHPLEAPPAGAPRLLTPVAGASPEDDEGADWLSKRVLPTLDGGPVTALAPESAARLMELALAAHEPTHAAALATLLILGAGVEPALWPGRWRAAEPVQQRLAEALKAIGPDRGHALRWPLLELCSATLRPLARPWREDLLWLLRSQIDLDQRVTLVEWIYYVLLRARLMPLAEMAWPGDESPADAAGAVRWVVQLLARVSQQPELRAERLTNELIRSAHLSRTGQGHPPFDVGGLQASVGALRRLPDLQRSLLMRELATFLPPDAPVVARDFLRVLAVIIDSPLPRFEGRLASGSDPVGFGASAAATADIA